MLARVVLLALLSSLVAIAAPPKQATRSEIAARAHDRRAAPLMARSSPAVCASGVRDSQGSCCAASTEDTANGQCCTENVYLMQTCGLNGCCSGGQSQILSVPATDQNGQQGFQNTCCPPGTVVTDNFMSTGNCAPGMRKRDLRALDLSKRDIQDPLRQMHFREGTWRTQLSPHLVADLLVDDWQMSYNGHTFIDWPARQATGSASFKKLAKYLPDTIKWRGTTDYLARAHADGQEFIPIPYSEDYEIALEDVPKLYRAIMEHPNFNGRSIEVNSIEYSPALMKEIFSHAHNWNATIHDLP